MNEDHVTSVLAESIVFTLWTATWENIPSGICAQRTLRSACLSAQSDQGLACPHEETMHLLLSKNAPSEDSDQTARMRSLVWIFTGCTCRKVHFLTLRFIYSSNNISNSSSLYTFHAIWLVERKVLLFNKVQTRNLPDLFSFQCWNHYLCEFYRCINGGESPTNLKAFGLNSVCERIWLYSVSEWFGELIHR